MKGVYSSHWRITSHWKSCWHNDIKLGNHRLKGVKDTHKERSMLCSLGQLSVEAKVGILASELKLHAFTDSATDGALLSAVACM